MKRTLMFTFSLAALTLLSACGGAVENQETTYKLDEVSTLNWKGIYADDSHNHFGTVEVKEGSVVYQGDAFKSGTFTVDLGTIVSELTPETGKDKLLSHLNSPRFFNSEAYPSVKVEILSIKDKNAELVIHVNKKEVKATVPVTVHKSDKELHIKGDFTVDFSSMDASGFKPDPEEEKIKPNQYVKPGVEFGLDITLKAEALKK